MAATIPQLVHSVGSPLARQMYNKTLKIFKTIIYCLTQKYFLDLCLSNSMFTDPHKTLQE